MKKGVVFPAGHGVPYNAEVGEKIDLSKIAKELGFEWCEIVRPYGLKRRFVMLVDEEGLCKGNPVPNIVGSFWYGETIVGNIMVLKEVMGPEGPELSGLTDEECEEVFNFLPKRGG